MEKVLVLGATGGMGYAITNELLEKGIEVSVFIRNKNRAIELFGNKVNVFTGDVFDLEALRTAANGMDVIFHAINIPYEQWEEKLLVLNQNIWSATKESSAKLVVVDNIYAYGRKSEVQHTESAVKQPHTKKGKLRLEVEKELKEAGIPYIHAHFPDFYGPLAPNTILHMTLKSVAENRKSMYVGNPIIQREYIYTPDGAKALVELSLHEKAYGQSWNIAGTGTISGIEILQIAQEQLGYSKTYSIIGKKMIGLLGIFNKRMKEVVEMLYLTEEPVLLDSSKYENEIGLLPRTPYQEGILNTIRTLQQQR
ncbi:NAD-dependent epimerase/dehydratase family protein [Peribacillus alkalitolerans]|uniref:NmrA family NAD(P)-binding protein n=1 Tax=Peribacillus alkalitolerans TaxID=1550385 RepID=UPI0013D2F97A|nr:NAD-dependent epimerase/dehydratase family protein [Peribacillus alkalitolerans]